MPAKLNEAQGRLRILTFSTVFPRPGEANLGLFVKARAAEIARLAEVCVVSPVALLEYGNPAGKRPGAMPAERLEGSLRVAHPRWFYLPGLKGLTPLLLALGAWRAVRRARPFDVIDAHFGHPEGFAATLLAWATHSPYTVTLRGNEPAHARSAVLRALMRRALCKAERVITVSGRLRDFAISLGVEPGRAVAIPNGIDPQKFFPRDREACRRKLGLDDAARHVLSVGYLIPRKGHHLAIDAVAALRAAGQLVELWIVGNAGRENGCESELRAQVERLGLTQAVHFIPAVPHAELAEYMTAADLLVLASSREGWPNVVHEALACGTPVVASDVGGVPDMLPEPRYGTVVPIGDAAALQAALARALEQEWDRAAISAWGHARTWEKVAEEALAQLQAAAERRKP